MKLEGICSASEVVTVGLYFASAEHEQTRGVLRSPDFGNSILHIQSASALVSHFSSTKIDGSASGVAPERNLGYRCLSVKGVTIGFTVCVCSFLRFCTRCPLAQN